MAGVRKQKSAHRPIMESGFPVIAITDAPCLFAAFTDAATTSVVPEKEKASTTSSFVIVIVERRLIWLSCRKKALLFMRKSFNKEGAYMLRKPNNSSAFQKYLTEKTGLEWIKPRNVFFLSLKQLKAERNNTKK